MSLDIMVQHNMNSCRKNDAFLELLRILPSRAIILRMINSQFSIAFNSATVRRTDLESFRVTFIDPWAGGKTSMITTTRATVRLTIDNTNLSVVYIDLLSMHCRCRDAVVVLHDLCCPSSFEHCKRLYEAVKNTDLEWKLEVSLSATKWIVFSV
jgi:hypothetical protein